MKRVVHNHKIYLYILQNFMRIRLTLVFSHSSREKHLVYFITQFPGVDDVATGSSRIRGIVVVESPIDDAF